MPPQPVFGAASYAFTVAEDTAVATQVATIRATVAGGAAVTHTLTADNPDGVWALDATTGELKVAGTLDYETAPTYHLIVEARSGPAAATAVPVTITVTNVDEPPVFDADSYAFSVAEDAHVGAAIGTVTARDPEGDTVIYDLTAGDTAGQWAVDALAGRLVVANWLDYESTTAYTLTVRAGVLGSSRQTATTTVTVTVTDVLDAPPAPTSLAATPAATSLALTWAAVTGATTYQVDYRLAEAETWTTAADDVTTAAATVPDLTCATAYEVRVRAYGSGAGYTAAWSAPSMPLAATTGTCPPPAFGAESFAFNVPENSSAGTAVGTITATTTGSGPVTYALTAGNDAGAFAIDADTGALTVAGALDHETTPSVSLTVEARAGGSQAATTATVTVTDVDEAPVFGAADYAFAVAEDAATDAAVGAVSAADPEEGALTYAITAGNEAGAFAIDAATGAITVAGALDHETADEYHLTVTARDAQGHTATADIAVSVTDVVFPPVFVEPSYAWSVAEDAAPGTAVGTARATDPEGGAVSYALTAGNAAGRFAIDASTGALTVAGALDHETTPSLSLTVQAGSGGGTATATVPVTVAVTNVDEAPAFGAADYAFSVAEDAAAGAAVGTVSATDPEGGAVSYALTAGNAAGAFAIAPTSGALTVAGALDAETTASYSLTVAARDAAGGTASATVTITVASVDEAPAFGAQAYSFSVAEDAALDAAVGAVTATDPEGGALTYALTAGNDAGAFALNAASGALTIAGALDYETTTSYRLTVTATDAADQAASVAVTITVTDAAFPPVFASPGYAWSVAEDAAAGAAVGTVSATDPEGGALTYAITAGNAAGAFALNPASGALTVAGALDHETAPTVSLTVSATSRSGTATATATVPVTVTVTNVDEAPAFGADSYAFTVAESVSIGTRIGTVTARDPEGGTVVYDITAGNSAGLWVVDALAGHVVVGAQLNHATTPSYSLTITASTTRDSPSATTTVTITVTTGS